MICPPLPVDSIRCMPYRGRMLDDENPACMTLLRQLGRRPLAIPGHLWRTRVAAVRRFASLYYDEGSERRRFRQ